MIAVLSLGSACVTRGRAGSHWDFYGIRGFDAIRLGRSLLVG